jgi:lipid-binding SYLF domain-containing protein
MLGKLAISILPALLFAGAEEDARLEAAKVSLSEIMAAGDNAVPQNLFEKAQCAVIIPGMKKGGFIFGGKYGRGWALCRQPSGHGWTAPVGVRVEGGSFGLQIGGSESDIILLVMNKKGMDRLLKSQFSLGGEASVAAGPVGRDSSAMTDATMRAEILSYSRSRGVFGGLALQGGTLRADSEADEALYGKVVDRKAVLDGKMAAPQSAQPLVATLTKYSGRAGK